MIEDDEEWVEYPIKDFLPSKKAQKNYKKFFKDMKNAQKKVLNEDEQKMKPNHINCQNPKCSICLSDAEKLERHLDEQCKTENKVDHLGKYHKWLMDNGINPETEIGWFTSDAFDDENIQNYITWYRENYT